MNRAGVHLRATGSRINLSRGEQSVIEYIFLESSQWQPQVWNDFNDVIGALHYVEGKIHSSSVKTL